MDVNKALDNAIRLPRIKSQANLARILGIAQASISGWREEGVPPIRALQIEKLTRRKVRRHDLCPDFDWSTV